MAKSVDLVYDRLIAGDKIRSSDKYEVLAAVVFSMLDRRATVHNMRLLGSSGVRHQIDVVMGSRSKRRRALVECKDYDRKIGLPLVRNFFGAVEDLGPDEAFMVTTVGYTKPARVYAAAKGIRLAMLRPPEGAEDWGNGVRQINVRLVMHVPAADPKLDWRVAPEDALALEGTPGSGRVNVDDVHVLDADGESQTVRAMLEEHVRPPDGWEEEDKVSSGDVIFEQPVLVRIAGWPELHMLGFGWSQPWTTVAHEFGVGDGVGGLAAELVLRTLDGEIHRIFTNRDLVAWTISQDGRIVPRREPQQPGHGSATSGRAGPAVQDRR